MLKSVAVTWSEGAAPCGFSRAVIAKSSQPGGNRKQLFCAIISLQCMYCRRGQEDVCFREEPSLVNR